MSEPKNVVPAAPAPLVIFLSAVSSEFHKGDPQNPQAFRSYRDCLRTELSALGDIRVVVQEELHQGFGDLLGTLDGELPQCRIMVHLLGDMAGDSPTPAELRRLKERHPDLLGKEPELKEAIGDGSSITYTQWELYLGFHHQISRLVFCATPDSERSPMAHPSAEDIASQQRHLHRVKITGEHRSTFHDQNHVTLQIIRALKREGLFMLNPSLITTPAQVQAAREDISAVAQEVAGHLKKPDPRAVPNPTPAGGNVLASAYRIVAESRGLTEQALVQLLESHLQDQTAALQQQRTSESLRELALTCLALADYPTAMAHARESADLAQAEIKAAIMPQLRPLFRDQALSALLLLADAAHLCHRREDALAALEKGGSLINRTTEPQFWASYHSMVGRALLDAGHYQPAEPLIRAVRDICERHPGKQNEDLIDSLLLLASLLGDQGNDRGVEVVALRALSLAENQMPQNLLTLGVCCQQLGFVCLNEGRHEEAEENLRFVLEAYQKIRGDEHPGTLTSRNNLASALAELGKHAEAEQEYRAVLAIRERVQSAEHPGTLTSRNNLAAMLDAQGKHTEAEQENRAVLAIRERVLGAEHPDTLSSRNNLASALNDQGKHDEAEQEHRAVLAIRERVLGAEHPDTLTSRNNLVSALADQGKHAEAEQENRAVLAIRQRVLGAEHPNTLNSRNNLASALAELGKHAEAEQEHRAVLAIRERVLGAEHPDTLSSRSNLAFALNNQGKYAEAEQEHRTVLATRERILGTEHIDTLTSRHGLARTLNDQGKYAEAEQEHRAVLAIRERVLGAEHEHVFYSCYRLALCLEAQKKLKEALEYIQRAESGSMRIFGADHPTTKKDTTARQRIEAALKLEQA